MGLRVCLMFVRWVLNLIGNGWFTLRCLCSPHCQHRSSNSSAITRSWNGAVNAAVAAAWEEKLLSKWGYNAGWNGETTSYSSTKEDANKRTENQILDGKIWKLKNKFWYQFFWIFFNWITFDLPTEEMMGKIENKQIIIWIPSQTSIGWQYGWDERTKDVGGRVCARELKYKIPIQNVMSIFFLFHWEELNFPKRNYHHYNGDCL